MKTILQMHTGSFGKANIEPMRAASVLSRLIGILDTKAVVWGWSRDRALNEAIFHVLARQKIPGYLWLPVFSETVDALPHDEFIFLHGGSENGIVLNADEEFQFVCPSSQRNIQNAIAMFGLVMRDLSCSGVFLDRIRYPSAANSVYALAGCQCESCRAAYARFGLDMESLRPLFQGKRTELLPVSVAKGLYTFKNAAVNSLFAVKRQIITSSVKTLCEHFRRRGMPVGIDTFAPAVADYVGQDTRMISKLVDFIKPMMYRRTDAPAGIGFEERAIEEGCGANRSGLSELWGGSLLGQEAMLRQLRELQETAGNVSPGIEVNRILGVCNTTPDYVRESVNIARQAGCDSIVLSWNKSQMDESILESLRSL